MVERVLESILHAIPVWIVSSNGFLPHELEAGLAAIATIELEGIFLKWQSMFDQLKIKRNGFVNVVLVDGNRGDIDVFKWVEVVRDVVPSTVVISLLDEKDEEAVSSAFQVGASGYLAPPYSVGQIASAISTAASGGIVISPVLMSTLMRIGAEIDHSHESHGLTSREIDLLRLLADGKSVKEIANSLSISYFTAETHVKNIRRKFGVDSSRKAVSIAIKEHLL